jgi:hypothetical protein
MHFELDGIDEENLELLREFAQLLKRIREATAE